MKYRTHIIFVCLFLLFSLPRMALWAQSADSTVLPVNKTKDFEITGDGKAANWSNEKWLVLPKRNENGTAYITKMKILYSDSGIYCLYHCEDNKLTSKLRENFSDLYNEDVVEAFFRTDERDPVYFEYELSPFNYELPILVPNIRGDYLGWRPWHYEGNRKTRHATHVFKNNGNILAWTAEFFIPYKLLKPLSNIPPARGTRWRANFYRIDYDYKVSDWSWQLTRTNFHDYERFGTLLFK
jgi:Carbohydrate family 9 binding domain-like